MNRLVFALTALSLCGSTPAAEPAANGPISQVDALYPALETLYVDLHKNPELAFHEQRTAQTLAAKVRSFRYEVTTGVGGTGVVAILRNGAGPTVMLRTELDALPIEEKTGLPFASTAKAKNERGELVPVAHMCGHDIHMTAWVGTAQWMAQNRAQWRGTLMLVGQPAEEIVAGAAAMLKDGLFERFPKPDYALGMHDEASLPAGTIGFHSGAFRAAVSNLDVTIFGKGGHGAAPQNAIDPIVIAARFVTGIQTIVSREQNPSDPAVITVGSIHGGTVWNIIPDKVTLQLTVRSFDAATHQRLLAAIAREAKGEALAANAPREPQIDVASSTDVVVNDPALTERMVADVRAALGAERVVEMPAKMGSEDFSQYGLAGARAVLLHVGAVDPARLAEAKRSGVPVPDVHSPLWAPLREPTIKSAVVAEVSILLDLMAPHP